jgi:excinuclease ABC subunit C
MRGADDAVLYVGKAKSLRARLRSYRDPLRQGPKTAVMARQVRKVETLVTDTEVEALILENALIKKHRPKYNITLRDDKTYPFLRLSVQEEFPALTVVRGPGKDGARYFGPYVPAGAMRKTVAILQRIFPLRKCRKALKARRGRPCLNFQMGRCLAPCAGRVTGEEYGKLVRGVALFLQGKGRELAEEYRKRMLELSGLERYEEAAILRDRIGAIEATLQKQKVHFPGRGDLDVLGSAVLGERRVVTVLHAAKGQIVGARTIHVRESPEEEGEMFSEFLRAFYDGASSVPPEILLPHRPAGFEAMEEWLQGRRGRRVKLRVPRVGPLRALVSLASRNAMETLERGKTRDGGEDAVGRLGTVAARLEGLRSLGAVDVSTISGTDTVASFVWWEGGRFKKSRYRRFRIGSSAEGDDYAAMTVAVKRLAARIERGSWAGPDILLLDGGKGHLSAVKRCLAGREWRPALIVAIAKPGEGRSSDAVYAEGRRDPLPLDRVPDVLRTLQTVRDEAHRFAVAYHRRVRSRRVLGSELEAVPGIGPERRKLLLRRFGSLERLRRASRRDLQAVEGLPAAVADDLFVYLRKWPGRRGNATRLR